MTASYQDSPYLTVEEVAAQLRVCTHTVRRLIAGRDIPAVRIGNQYRIHRDTLSTLAGVPTR